MGKSQCRRTRVCFACLCGFLGRCRGCMNRLARMDHVCICGTSFKRHDFRPRMPRRTMRHNGVGSYWSLLLGMTALLRELTPCKLAPCKRNGPGTSGTSVPGHRRRSQVSSRVPHLAVAVLHQGSSLVGLQSMAMLNTRVEKTW